MTTIKFFIHLSKCFSYSQHLSNCYSLYYNLLLNYIFKVLESSLLPFSYLYLLFMFIYYHQIK